MKSHISLGTSIYAPQKKDLSPRASAKPKIREGVQAEGARALRAEGRAERAKLFSIEPSFSMEKALLKLASRKLSGIPRNRFAVLIKGGYFDGVDLTPRAIRNPEVLRILLIEWMADPYRKFSVRRFSQTYLVPERYIRMLARSDEISKEVKQRARDLAGAGETISKAYRVLVAKAKTGSFKHLRLLLEMTGEYTPSLKVGPDMDSMEARFKELEDQRKTLEIRRKQALTPGGEPGSVPKALPEPPVLFGTPSQD